LQALVDRKKVVITEATIRDVLHLDDAEGVDCLPNEEIFAELVCMDYEKPSTKLTFYKDLYSSQWKFLIHIILQSMSAKRISWNEFSSAMTSAVICLSTGNLSSHTTKYISPALTQKVFANMRGVRKGFSGVETPLFEGMLVAGEIEEQGDAEEQVQDNVDDAAQGADTAILGDDEALDACATLTRRVEHLEHDKVAQALEITKLKKRVKKLERANKVKVLKLRRLKKVVVAVSESVTAASATIAAVLAATITAASNVVGFRLDYFKEMSYDDIRPIFEAKFNSNIEFLLKSKEQIEEEENRAIESINETQAQKAAKRSKLNEEVEDLKQHLQIVPDEDDDVYTEATPLARKVPVVDYHIIQLNNKPHYKIIRADGTHQLYVSFIT
nr:hypothetical protein [Tanacetum cinerariifolium]